MNLLLALFLIVFEAAFEGLKAIGWHIPSEFIEGVFLLVVIPATFAFVNGYGNPKRKPVYYSWRDIFTGMIIILVGYVLLRFSIFDSLWNLFAGQKWNYYGTTKLYDRIMFELGGFGWMMKFIFGIIGICFLLGIDEMQDIIDLINGRVIH